jgi:hypothetical protein
MKVHELIKKLEVLPKEAEVYHLWDGELRTKIEVVYLAKSGDVATADYAQVCYSDISRPIGAPGEEQARFWETQESPENGQ